MTRQVYANGKQYSSVGDITEALYETWDATEMDTIKSFIEPMPRRCKECIKKHGNKTHY
ncbi:hypothetical protein PC129_g8793 [Phytophthora cactorum]|uniref:Uncharacterized protein n=1 Tax=Phytophthora cactorum TaxID=29920 RepID=A0A8T1I736_9STRA|nr:hypothetical protein Pcac1_g28021 [Phytophthora cactorum]KAG2825233.1 hypothetical protein PC111_g9485 [Phytophthora cactorum]KAG2826068.1 hypothetical protein PC112_g9444 [Phytophthora cactorum]KAG2856844.1 hypothetical protein PC113_g11228 [Phytophthora cactorum]KAG2908614.1 hypothetical protein PC114_g10398 [Phytophthora cactorum]